MQVAGISGDKGGVRVFAGVIEDPHGPSEPAKVCLVAHDHGVVAALCHKGTQAGDAPGGTVKFLGHRMILSREQAGWDVCNGKTDASCTIIAL